MRLSERKLLAKDALRALLVLALVFLNFSAHAQPLGVAYTGDLKPYVLADGSVPVLCAQDPHGDDGDHVPCHACRIGFDLALPPAPDCAEPAFRAAARAYYVPHATGIALDAHRPAPSARGPPLA